MNERLNSSERSVPCSLNELEHDTVTMGGFEVRKYTAQPALVATDALMGFMAESMMNEAYVLHPPIKINDSWAEMHVDALTQFPNEMGAIDPSGSRRSNLLVRRFVRTDLAGVDELILDRREISSDQLGDGSGYIDLSRSELYLLNAEYDSPYRKYTDGQPVSYLTLALIRDMAIHDWETTHISV